jgi:hypothetical protein
VQRQPLLCHKQPDDDKAEEPSKVEKADEAVTAALAAVKEARVAAKAAKAEASKAAKAPAKATAKAEAAKDKAFAEEVERCRLEREQAAAAVEAAIDEYEEESEEEESEEEEYETHHGCAAAAPRHPGTCSYCRADGQVYGAGPWLNTCGKECKDKAANEKRALTRAKNKQLEERVKACGPITGYHLFVREHAAAAMEEGDDEEAANEAANKTERAKVRARERAQAWAACPNKGDYNDRAAANKLERANVLAQEDGCVGCQARALLEEHDRKLCGPGRGFDLFMREIKTGAIQNDVGPTNVRGIPEYASMSPEDKQEAQNQTKENRKMLKRVYDDLPDKQDYEEAAKTNRQQVKALQPEEEDAASPPAKKAKRQPPAPKKHMPRSGCGAAMETDEVGVVMANLVKLFRDDKISEADFSAAVAKLAA